MLLQAIRDYDIDVSQSYMIGDSQSDIDAGKAAGLHTNGCMKYGNTHIGWSKATIIKEAALQMY